jgi:hypothetical protein
MHRCKIIINYIDRLYEAEDIVNPTRLPMDELHVFEHEYLAEWFVTSEL